MKSSMNGSLQNSFSANNPEMPPKGRKSSICREISQIFVVWFDGIFFGVIAF